MLDISQAAVRLLAVRWTPRNHVALAGVILAGVILRVGVEIAYRPALFFSDSWEYLNIAYSTTPVGIAPSRPSGYPLLLRLLMFPGRDVLLVTVLQHVAGLVVGALVYGLLLHLGVRRLLAAAAAAVVVLNSYELALEQFLMAEALFTLLLTGAMFLTIVRAENPRALMFAGLLLAIAATLRTAALFVIPVWLIYLVWTARDRRRLTYAVAGVALPLLIYASLHYVRTDGSFGLEQSQGWFLYGRVAQIADCRGASVPRATYPLCNTSARVRKKYPPDVWIWGASPAERLFSGNPDYYVGRLGGHPQTARIDGLLNDFALAIVRRHPLAYARTAVLDFLRFFDPGAPPSSDADGVTVTFPRRPLANWIAPAARKRYLPHYVPHVHWPASLLQKYQRVFQAPRLLLGAISIVAVLALLAPVLSFGRLPVRRRAEIFLLTGSGIVMLLASAAFVAFVVRYLIPSIPLLASGGLLAVNELIRAVKTSRFERARSPAAQSATPAMVRLAPPRDPRPLN